MAKTNGTLRFLKDNWFLIIVASSFISSSAIIGYKTNCNTRNIESIIKEFNDCKLEVHDLKKDIYYLTEIMGRNERSLNELVQEIRNR